MLPKTKNVKILVARSVHQDFKSSKKINQKYFIPKTKAGKWSVRLNGFFLITIIISIFLVKILKILNFDNQWWDITAAAAFPASIIAFILGIIAKTKYQDNSISVTLSIFLGLAVILFIVFHSFFIAD